MCLAVSGDQLSDDRSLPSSDSADTSDKEINILLLGETGVGKSTWINGFANYVMYENFEEFESHDPVCLTATSFVFTDDICESINISTRLTQSEITGESEAQYPQTYEIRINGGVVRLIDTPGVGDTRGIEHDENNIKQILHQIVSIKKLHGICILLKPDIARMHIMFEYCLKMIFTSLHRDACRNVVFCFTSCRRTFYMPEDTLSLLRRLLIEVELKIDLNNENIFCFDNEAMRYIVARKFGIVFHENLRRVFMASWNNSVMQFDRLLEHFAAIEPHLVEKTLSVNYARQVLLEGYKPLTMVAAVIQNNLKIKVMQIRQLEDEERHISMALSMLSHFLKISAIAPSNTATDKYLELCIANTSVIETTQRLKQIRQKNIENKDILSQIRNDVDANLKLPTPSEIYSLIPNLFALEHFGLMIQGSIKMIDCPSLISEEPADIRIIHVPGSKKNVCQFFKNKHSISSI